MRSVALVVSCCCVGLALGACHHAAGDKLGAAPSKDVSASASASTSASSKLDPQDAHAVAMMWNAIGCFVGGPWSEALGAVAEERTLADIARCREVATKMLGAKVTDAPTLEALRAVDAEVVERVVDAFVRATPKLAIDRKNKTISILRASADASREALAVRKVASALRAAGAKLDDDATKTLSTTKALEALSRTDGVEAKVVFYVLAADRLEAARGLPTKAKLAVGAPAIHLLFGVAAKSDETDDTRAWLDLLEAAGHTAKHVPAATANTTANATKPPTKPGSADDARTRETNARMMIAEALAEKFDDARKQLENGEILSVASGYVDRLRASIAEAREKQKMENESAGKSAPSAAASITSP